MSEELKDKLPPIEVRPASVKTAEELLKESKDRIASWSGSETIQKGKREIDAFLHGTQAWESVDPPQTIVNETEHAKSTWALQERHFRLESGGKLTVKKGYIHHQSLLPDQTGYKIPETEVEFTGVGLSASFAPDNEGRPTRSIVLELPSDSRKKRVAELFSPNGFLRAESGTPEYDALEMELAVELGQGLRVLPKQPTEQEAIAQLEQAA